MPLACPLLHTCGSSKTLCFMLLRLLSNLPQKLSLLLPAEAVAACVTLDLHTSKLFPIVNL